MELGVELYSIEYHQALHERSSFLLKKMGYKGHYRCGDGSIGWEEQAPYDGIIVTAGAPMVPEALRAQLKVGGRLVLPVGSNETQEMLRLTKTEEGWEEENFGCYSFVPLRGKEGWDK